jgi:hypothetical protein
MASNSCYYKFDPVALGGRCRLSISCVSVENQLARNRTKPIAELDTILKMLRDTSFDNSVISQLSIDIPLVCMVESDVHDIIVSDLQAEIVYDITSEPLIGNFVING